MLSIMDYVSGNMFKYWLRLRDSLRGKKVNCRRYDGMAFNCLEVMEPRLMMSGTNYVVDSTADVIDANDGVITLREAINAASTNQIVGDAPAGVSNGEDKITFDPTVFSTAKTIVLDDTLGEFDILDKLEIVGPSETLTLNAQGYSRLFNVYPADSSDVVSISNLTLTNGESNYDGGAIYHHDYELNINNMHITLSSGSDGGGIYINDGTINITNSEFDDNSAYNSGGGIYINDGTLNITNSEIDGNSAYNSGGGVYSNNISELNINTVDISGNTATYDGGGVYTGSYSNYGNVVITNTTISENETTYGHGGALFIMWAEVEIIDSTFSENASGEEGGGIYVIAGSDVELDNTTISDNVSEDSGGGISNHNSDLDLIDSEIIDNQSGFNGAGVSTQTGSLDVDNTEISGNITDVTTPGAAGGGIYSYDNQTIITDSIISNNQSTHDGGGIRVTDSDFTVIGSTIEGNVSFSNGGGVSGFGNDIFEIINSELVGNSAEYGGGIENRDHLTIIGSSISGNYAEEDGGGVYTFENSFAPDQYEYELNLISTHVYGNRAGATGGGIYNSDAEFNMINSIISSNSGIGLYNLHTKAVISSSTIAYHHTGVSHGAGGPITLQNTIVSENTSVDIIGSFASDNLIGTDPLFVGVPSSGIDGWGDDPNTPADESLNDDYGDLRLLSTSPAVDAGDELLLPEDDYDLDGNANTSEDLPVDHVGKKRIIYNDSLDIGAHEYVIPGDASYDGSVDLIDLAALANNFGATEGAIWGEGDFNSDGKVDLNDLAILATYFGESTGAATPSEVLSYSYSDLINETASLTPNLIHDHDDDLDVDYDDVDYAYENFQINYEWGELDFDQDIDADDIDLLSEAVADSSTDLLYDVDRDGDIDSDDRLYLINTILGVDEGDVNLDGIVSALDYDVIQNNQSMTNAGWADGDMNGDGEVDLADLAKFATNYDGYLSGGTSTHTADDLTFSLDSGTSVGTGLTQYQLNLQTSGAIDIAGIELQVTVDNGDTVSQSNPFSLPTVYTDYNSLFASDSNADIDLDSQWLFNSSSDFSSTTGGSESSTSLTGEFMLDTSLYSDDFDLAQVVVTTNTMIYIKGRVTYADGTIRYVDVSL